MLIFGGKCEKDAIPGWKGDFFAFLSLDSNAPWFFVLEIYIYYDTVWYLIFEQIVIFIDTDLQPCPSLSSPDHEFFFVFFVVRLPQLETNTSKLKY